jgi:hypothetical protein
MNHDDNPLPEASQRFVSPYIDTSWFFSYTKPNR